MTPRARKHWTIGGLWTGAVVVVGALGALTKFVVAIDEQTRNSGRELDSLWTYARGAHIEDSTAIAGVRRAVGMKRRLPDGPPLPAFQSGGEGLAQRLLHLVWRKRGG